MLLRRHYFHLIFILTFLPVCILIGQDTIYLQNPSFEDVPRKGGQFSAPIKGWMDCGTINFPNESPPDIMPTQDKAWGVDVQAIDGNTYLSLVVRYNDSWESVSQKLKKDLLPSKCYFLETYLCRSEIYKSLTRISPDHLQDFTTPVVLQIWGGKFFCDKQSLLARSEPIKNTAWQLYSLTFQPDQVVSYITIEAYYYTPLNENYNGHLLLDGLSPIIETDCK